MSHFVSVGIFGLTSTGLILTAYFKIYKTKGHLLKCGRLSERIRYFFSFHSFAVYV